MNVVHIGIDIAKDTFTAAAVNSNGLVIAGSRRLLNKPEGFKKLVAFINSLVADEIHVCMEATNVYWEQLAHYLHRCGLVAVHVVNPRRTHAHAESNLSRSKTDAADAATVALFSVSRRLKEWQPLEPEVARLCALVRLRQSMVESRVAALNRLDALRRTELRDALVIEHVRREIRYFSCEIKQIDKQIRKHIAAHPVLADIDERFRAIPGVGDIVSASVMTHLLPLRGLRDNQIATHAGLSPAKYESGSSVHRRPRVSKIGSTRLRRVAYMSSLSGIRYNPVLRAFYERLRANGKCAKVALVACARKTIVIMNAMINNNSTFDPTIHLKTT